MALNAYERVQFRNWLIKSFFGPLLAVLIFTINILLNVSVPYAHLIVLACLLFGGFPLFNIVFEENKFFLAIFHALHGVLTFFPVIYLLSENDIFPPMDLILVLISWFWSQSALLLLMPQTALRVESLKNWRKDTLQRLVKAHYEV